MTIGNRTIVVENKILIVTISYPRSWCCAGAWGMCRATRFIRITVSSNLVDRCHVCSFCHLAIIVLDDTNCGSVAYATRLDKDLAVYTRFRPFGSSNLRGIFKEIESSIDVQDFTRLIILKDRIPTTTSSATTRDLTTLFKCFGTTSLTGTSIPRPIHTRFGTPWVMRDLEESLSSLVFTNKST